MMKITLTALALAIAFAEPAAAKNLNHMQRACERGPRHELQCERGPRSRRARVPLHGVPDQRLDQRLAAVTAALACPRRLARPCVVIADGSRAAT
jgi:hypothetical protein